MNKNYIPILVQGEESKEIWRLDIANLSVTDLIKLKDELKKTPYDKTIQSLDAVIRSEVDNIITTRGINNCSYVRTFKKKQKEEKRKKKIKSLRRKYDKYKR